MLAKLFCMRITNTCAVGELLNRCASLSTSCIVKNQADEDGEPSFLEMVGMYADNAHALALDHLLELEQAPGQKKLDKETREYKIKG